MTKLQEQALRKGTQIAVYEIIEVLGRNTSEILYRAWNEHLNTSVILKEFFPSDFVMRDEEDQSVRGNSKKDMAVFDYGMHNFLRHYEKLLAVQHPGIQNAHNILEFNHTAYLALDDVQGDLLSGLLENSKTFNEEELRIILTGLLKALQGCHENDIFHGDIHPENILIKKNNLPVLHNFGSARQAFARHVKMLPFELHRGGYAAPEQFEKEGYENASADLYGLGATIYRCIFNKDPQPEVDKVKPSNQKNNDEQQSIVKQAVENYSEEFLQVIEWMLKPDAKSRPQSVAEVLFRLNQDDKNRKALEIAYPEKSEISLEKPSDSDEKQGHSGVIAALLSIAIIVVGVAIFWTIQNKNKAIVTERGEIAGSTTVNSFVETQDSAEKMVRQAEVSEILPEVNSDESEQGENPAAEELLDKPGETQVDVVSQKDLENMEIKSEGVQAVESESSDLKVDAERPQQQNESVVQNSELQSEAKDLIDQYLKKAGQRFAKYQLTTPVDDNAYNYYLAVLDIDPKHVGAQNGLRMIVDLYVRLIDKAVREKNYDLARLYMSRAKEILPDSPKLKQKTDELSGLAEVSTEAN